MSLDLYIKKKDEISKNVKIFVTDNGEEIEIKCYEDFLKYIDSDADEWEYQDYIADDEDVWWRNITHNLGKMAAEVNCGKYTLYDLLWRPSERGFNTVTEGYKLMIYEGIKQMLIHRDELAMFNPSNGWGDYDGLLDFVVDYATVLSKLDKNESYIIIASV